MTVKFKPTDEQQAIMDAGAAGMNVVVKAGAGSGKTTTLNAASEGMRGRGLYAAYNKALQVDAEGRFPQHVECRTAHSLAYQSVGRYYRNRLNGPRQPAREVARLLRINQPIQLDKDHLIQPTQIARYAIDTVDRYCSSAADEIAAKHVPYLDGADVTQQAAINHVVLPYAQRMWEELRLTDKQGGGKFQFKHDYYVKIWSLATPILPFDFILYDEAQDASPVIAKVIQAQQDHAQVIVVGDENQQLYQWRGSIDALSTWPADAVLKLSESFRFGQEIGDEANKWLTLLGSDMRIIGRGGPSTVGDIKGWPDAILCRTNGCAMSNAMDAMDDGKQVALVGGGDQIRRLAEAAIELKQGNGTWHPELAMFNTWQEVQDYVTHEAGGSDLKTAVSLIDRFGAETVIDAVDRLVPDKPQKGRRFTRPDLVISTAHRAKGLEWGAVRIADDFKEPLDEDGEPAPVPRTDAMLAYVAVTRASHVLDRGGLSYVDSRIRPAVPAMA